MPYDHLADFLAHLQDDRELRRVSAEVDPHLEITEIASRLCGPQQPGPALLFERVRYSPLPLAVNLLGSERRILRALGARNFPEIVERLNGPQQGAGAESWLQRLKQVATGNTQPPWKPQVVKTASCQQVVKVGRDIDLRELPAVQSWPDEAGRFFTGAVAILKHPDTGARIVETFPVQVLDRQALGIYCHPWNAVAQALTRHRALGTQLPMALVFGGDPTWSLLTSVPVPARMDPLEFGGCLRGQALEIVRGRQVDLDVPAGAEIVLEGYFDSQEPPTRGGSTALPHGYYSAPQDVPVLHVTTVTHRGNPVLSLSLSGRTEFEEDARLQFAARLCLPMLQGMCPGVVDLAFPPGFGPHQICVVGLQKSYPHQAQQVMHAVWCLQHTLLTKWVLVVDADVSVHDSQQVWRALLHQAHPARDFVLNEGPAAPTEHANPIPGLGSRVGIDATRKWPAEGHARPWPEALAMSAKVSELVTQRWAEYQLG